MTISAGNDYNDWSDIQAAEMDLELVSDFCYTLAAPFYTMEVVKRMLKCALHGKAAKVFF